MVISTLPDLLPYVDNGLWFALERSDFAPNVLGCFPDAYRTYIKSPVDKKSPQTGGRRHDMIIELLRDMFKRDYNAKLSKEKNQVRITIQSPSGTFFTFLVRHARAVDGGFSSTKVGAMTEKVSLFHETPEELPLIADHPNQKGIFLAHHESKNDPRRIDVWLAYEWRAYSQDDFITCERCAHLGSIDIDGGSTAVVFPQTPTTGGTVLVE